MWNYTKNWASYCTPFHGLVKIELENYENKLGQEKHQVKCPVIAHVQGRTVAEDLE